MNLVEAIKFNFFDKDRYIYILEGLKVTITVTVFALLIGVILGVLIGMVRAYYEENTRRSKPVIILNAICETYITVIRGTPVLVQLLIMYFGILSIPGISKVLVAIITFGINSGAYVAEIVRSGIMSIDKGQMEAGRCLGLSYSKVMRYIIIPQAFKNILPALANEMIALLKETSICGYIGLMDLTRAGDNIRSQTFAIWVPMIVVALIYLCLVLIMSRLVKILERRLRRSDIR